MPMLKPVIAEDPFAQLAWDSSVAILALEKLCTKQPLNDSEVASLEKILIISQDAMDALSSEREPPTPGDPLYCSSLLTQLSLSGEVRRDQRNIFQDTLATLPNDLKGILSAAESGSDVNLDVLDRAQSACLSLLRGANNARTESNALMHLDS